MQDDDDDARHLADLAEQQLREHVQEHIRRAKAKLRAIRLIMRPIAKMSLTIQQRRRNAAPQGDALQSLIAEALMGMSLEELGQTHSTIAKGQWTRITRRITGGGEDADKNSEVSFTKITGKRKSDSEPRGWSLPTTLTTGPPRCV